MDPAGIRPQVGRPDRADPRHAGSHPDRPRRRARPRDLARPRPAHRGIERIGPAGLLRRARRRSRCFARGRSGLSTAAAVLAAIPFAVISSAVAIPSSAGLADRVREFVIYESSLSDILGVLVFYSWLGANGSVARFRAGSLRQRRTLPRRRARDRAGRVLRHQPDRGPRALPAAARGDRLPLRRWQGAAPVAARAGAGLRARAQQSAAHPLACVGCARSPATTTARR